MLTRRGTFAARVVFDKKAWDADKDAWSLPFELLDASVREGDGTTVSLTGLTRSFDPAEVEQRLITGTRVRGEVNADFLPVTSDRSGFILDSPEYLAFREVMKRVAREVAKVLVRTSVVREGRRSGRAVKEVLQRMHTALARNPEFSPFGPIPYGERQPGLGGAAVVDGEGGGERGHRRRGGSTA